MNHCQVLYYLGIKPKLIDSLSIGILYEISLPPCPSIIYIMTRYLGYNVDDAFISIRRLCTDYPITFSNLLSNASIAIRDPIFINYMIMNAK